MASPFAEFEGKYFGFVFQDEQGCRFLKQHGISQLWTPGSREDFSSIAIKKLFGYELFWDYMLDNEQWGSYHSLHADYRDLLARQGITAGYSG